MLPALLDHLWQSTLFALGAALLMLALRRAPAAVRHGLWFSASIKFLIPFAVLAAAGAMLAPDIRLPAPAAQAALIETAAEPFSQVFGQTNRLPTPRIETARLPSSPAAAPPPSAPALSQAPIPAAAAPPGSPAHHLAPALILLVAWALGSLAILARWTMRWRRLHRAIRSARLLAWPAPMPVLASPWLIEPGLAGLLRPVLILPETLPERLTRSEIDAIVAHEACHLRRRDNLTAAAHMLVEALFWFHPLVWWIGGRLIAERELACDEAVVRAGHDRAAYARSLVESCRLYLQSPLDCVAGASGSNLKTRVEAILTAPLAPPLSRPKKALLLAAGACAFATPVAAGLLTPEEKAAAPLARAVAAIAAPARALAASANEGQPDKPVVLAQNEPVLAPGQSIARPDAVSGPLAQDLAAPRVDPAQAAPGLGGGPISFSADRIEKDDQTRTVRWVGGAQVVGDLRRLRLFVNGQPASADFDPNGVSFAAIEVKSAPDGNGGSRFESMNFIPVEEAPPARPIQPSGIGSSTAQPANVRQASSKAEAFDFVQGYAAVTRRGLVSRWFNPICVRVVGLSSEQASAVRARVEEIARGLGVGAQAAGCQRADIEIGFTAQPQHMLDQTVAANPRLLGDRTSGTEGVKTVTGPIQAWYLTNGVEVAENAAEGLKARVGDRSTAGSAGWAALKALVDMQTTPQAQADANYWAQSQGSLLNNPYPYDPERERQYGYGSGPNGVRSNRQFLNAMVIVDTTKTAGSDLRALTDYAAMLAMAQPRSLGGCQALSSITDLFAGCPGRSAPTGLTPADTAYLSALYGAKPADATAIAQRMAGILGNATASAAAEPPAAPAKPVRPAAFRGPEPSASSPALQLASYSSSDLSRQARDFVQSNARVGQFGYTVRWREPLCLQVFGLTPEQNAAVMSRIDAVAQTLAQKVYSPRHQSCPQKNVTILFSTDPQRALDRMIAHDPWFLGDARSDTRGIKTVTRPIQAWRVTVCVLTVCRPDPFPQEPLAATVLVDARRVDNAKLGAIADYVAMLVLADPRNRDHCQALPSVLDLFAGPCAGRSTPTGLTRGDLSFLKALYTAGSPITQRDWNWSEHGGSVDQIAGRMSMLLAGSGTLMIPGAQPVLR